MKEAFEAWLQRTAANSPIGYIGILQRYYHKGEPYGVVWNRSLLSETTEFVRFKDATREGISAH